MHPEFNFIAILVDSLFSSFEPIGLTELANPKTPRYKGLQSHAQLIRYLIADNIIYIRCCLV